MRTWVSWLGVWLVTGAAIADPPHAAPGASPGVHTDVPTGAPGVVRPAPAVRWMAAPDFTLESTAGVLRRRRNYAGRVMVILYEDREANHQNDALKRELALQAERSDLARGVSLLPVADLHGYDFWPAAGFARSAVVDIAHTLGVEILMDWSGDMARAYRFRPGQSHVLVVNREGAVVFRHDGVLDPARREAFFSALGSALGGPDPDHPRDDPPGGQWTAGSADPSQ